MRLLGLDSVLCLSPHPDDIEYSMAGTILKYKDTHFHSIVFSTGSVYDPVSNQERWEECARYWRNSTNITQDFMALLLKTYSEEEWLNLLEKKFPLKKYQAIFLPPLQDTHYEHRFVHHVGMAMTRVTPASVIEYKSASVQDIWVPNLFVPLHYSLVDEKIERLKEFKSQDKVYLKRPFMGSYHIHINSLKKNIQYVEQFRTVIMYND